MSLKISSCPHFALHLAIAARKGNELPNLSDFVLALGSNDSSNLMWHVDYSHIKRRIRLRGKNVVSFTEPMQLSV